MPDVALNLRTIRADVSEFQLDALAPGCRELTLHADGSWETAVHRVTDEMFSVDLNSPGYA